MDNEKRDKKVATAKARSGFNQKETTTPMGEGVPQSTVDFFEDVRKPLIRSTPMEDFGGCPRKFLYRYKLGIRTRSYESPLFMGGIVHSALQQLVMGSTTDQAMTYVATLVSKEQAKLMDAASQDGFLPGGDSLEVTLKKLDEDYHKARAMALVFWKFRPFKSGEWDVLKAPDGTPMVETLLTVKHPQLGRPFRTPCDLVLLKKGTNEVWIWDYKTTSFDPKARAIPTQFSPQLQLYRWSLQAQLDLWAEEHPSYPEYKVVGSVHAIIKKPTIKYCPNTKDKAGFSSYIKRMVEWYEAEEAKSPDHPPIILDPNRFSGPPMTDELWGRLVEYNKAAGAQPNIHHFYRAGDYACLQFNKVCPYMQLCNSDPSVWPEIVRRSYEIGFREDDEDNQEKD